MNAESKWIGCGSHFNGDFKPWPKTCKWDGKRVSQCEEDIKFVKFGSLDNKMPVGVQRVID